jgi:gliding motility-associated-like protein
MQLQDTVWVNPPTPCTPIPPIPVPIPPTAAQEDVFFANAFSPNGDGVNDVFRALPPTSPQGLSGYTLSVYNRWGNKVFSTQNYTQAWAGTDAVMGAYTYICTYTFKGKNKIKKGEVVLVK